MDRESGIKNVLVIFGGVHRSMGCRCSRLRL